MKKTTIALGSTIACLFLLAACTDATAPSTSSTSTTKTTTQTQQVKNDQSASLTINGTEQSGDQVTSIGEKPSDKSQSDIVANQTAMELNDLSYCDKIQDSQFKTECITNVTDKITLAQSIEKLDSSICDKLSSNNLQIDCKTQVEVSKKKAAEENDRQTQSDKSNDVIAAGDYTRCAKELTDPIFVNNCEMNILYSKAINSRDISYCKKISDAATEQSCEKQFNNEPKPAPNPAN